MKFTDVTLETGVGGRGYSMGAAAADYNNDGHTDYRHFVIFRMDALLHVLSSILTSARSGSLAPGWGAGDPAGNPWPGGPVTSPVRRVDEPQESTQTHDNTRLHSLLQSVFPGPGLTGPGGNAMPRGRA